MELYENELMILYLFYLKTINYIQFPEEESETYNKYLFPYGKIENSINTQIKIAKKEIKVHDFQLLYMEKRLYLIIKHKKSCKYLLDL